VTRLSSEPQNGDFDMPSGGRGVTVFRATCPSCDWQVAASDSRTRGDAMLKHHQATGHSPRANWGA